MNKEIKEKWCAALRSGEYKQGTRFLRTKIGSENHFCCLGVLCDLAVKEGIISDFFEKENVTHSFISSKDFEEITMFLPSEIQKWSGINTPLGTITFSHGDNNLAKLNDNGSSFEEIANVIEENF